MTVLVLYLSIATLMLYTEALDCYRNKVKFDFIRSLIFSLVWVVGIPYSVHMIWKESEQ